MRQRVERGDGAAIWEKGSNYQEDVGDKSDVARMLQRVIGEALRQWGRLRQVEGFPRSGVSRGGQFDARW